MTADQTKLTEKEITALRQRYRELSMVCFPGCTASRPCSACREQDSITERLKGYKQ